jgi:hypothetical protein
MEEESVEASFVSSEAKSLTPHVAKANGEGHEGHVREGQAQPRKAAVQRGQRPAIPYTYYANQS